MSPDMAKNKENYIADIVVIGGGGAGLTAAVAAGEKGVRIIVLERRKVTGGSSAMAVGPFAAESPAQRRQGIIALKDELFKRAMNWAHLKINPRIIRAFIDRSGDTIRWLEERGLYFVCVQHSLKDHPLTWHVSKGNGAEIIKLLVKEFKRLGGEILLRTQAKRILIGQDGEVTGVEVKNDDQEYVIETKAVIIATGGFGGNKELLKKYYPLYQDNIECAGVPNMGDGLLMAMEIGAATQDLGTLLLVGPTVKISTKLNIGDEGSKQVVPLRSIPREPYMVWVNKKGRRFINEDSIFHSFVSSNAVIRQPENLAYVMFDDNIATMMIEQGLTNPLGADPFTSAQRGKTTAGLKSELQRVATEKTDSLVKVSGSWNEIADWIGADPNVLKDSIDKYNRGCDHGYDPIFAKDRAYLIPLRHSPYYVIKCKTEMMNTMGGIKINEYMEVLDKGDNSIPGCYAAGVDTGGWTSDTYCNELPGTAFGFALNSGFIAGEEAAKYVQVK